MQLLAGDHATAEQSFRVSASGLSALGFTGDALRAGYFWALAGARSGRRGAPREELEACRAGFAARQMVGWTALVDDALGRLVGSNGARLTPTETTITARVRAGMRNKEIAADLFVSESTVEAHLTRIYRKLDIRGRQQLAVLTADVPAGA